jgi:hypothetical protein
MHIAVEQPKPLKPSDNVDTLSPTTTSPTDSSKESPIVIPSDSKELSLWVCDFSKYGTFVDSQRVGTQASEWVRVGVGQSIYLGPYPGDGQKHQSVATGTTTSTINPSNTDFVRLTVTKIPFVVSYTRLDSSLCEEALSIIQRLGGVLTRAWSPQCTHLIIKGDNMVVSEKIILAIVNRIPLITVEWLRAIELIATPENVSSQKSVLLDPKSYSLRMDWPEHLQSPNGTQLNRRHLFMDQLFVFVSEASYRRCHNMIEAAGGKVQLISSLLTEKALRAMQDWIVVEPLDDNSKHAKTFKMVRRCSESIIGAAWTDSYGPGLCSESSLGGAILYGTQIQFVHVETSSTSEEKSSSQMIDPPTTVANSTSTIVTNSFIGAFRDSKRKAPPLFDTDKVVGFPPFTIASIEELDFGSRKKKRRTLNDESKSNKPSTNEDDGLIPPSQGIQLEFQSTPANTLDVDKKKRKRQKQSIDEDIVVAPTKSEKEVQQDRLRQKFGILSDSAFSDRSRDFFTTINPLKAQTITHNEATSSASLPPITSKAEVTVPFMNIRVRKSLQTELKSSQPSQSNTTNNSPVPTETKSELYIPKSEVELFEKLTINTPSIPQKCSTPTSSAYGVNYKPFRKAVVI